MLKMNVPRKKQKVFDNKKKKTEGQKEKMLKTN